MMINDLLREVSNYIYPACLLTVLFCIAFLFMNEQNACNKLLVLWHERKKLVIFLFYLAFLMMTTVMGRHTTMPCESVFAHMFFRLDDVGWNNEIIENMLVFIPLTFLYLNSLPAGPRRSCQTAAKLAFGTSVFIELSQLIFWLGEFQFSDILYNTIGGLLGFGAWRIYCQVMKVCKKE